MSNFQPYLVVITNFNRTNQSIVTLVALSSNRRIDLSPDADISTTIREHYTANHGICSIFGTITKYHHFQRKGEYTVYNVDGMQVSERIFRAVEIESAFIA